MIRVTSIELAKEYVWGALIHQCINIMKESGVEYDKIERLYTNISTPENGESKVCHIANGDSTTFIVYMSLESPNIRVVFDKIVMVDGQHAATDYIIKFDDETHMGAFEFAPIVQPSGRGSEFTQIMPYSYLSGMIAGYLSRISETMMLIEEPISEEE